jgi:hypothetical protein
MALINLIFQTFDDRMNFFAHTRSSVRRREAGLLKLRGLSDEEFRIFWSLDTSVAEEMLV